MPTLATCLAVMEGALIEITGLTCSLCKTLLHTGSYSEGIFCCQSQPSIPLGIWTED